MATEWYYGEANQQRGPVTVERLQELARSGQILPQTLVWNEQMSGWEPAGRVPEVAALLNEKTEAETGVAVAEMAATAPPVTGGATQGVLSYQAPGQEELICTPRAVELLRQTKPWVQLVAVLLYIGGGLVLLGGLIVIGLAVLGGNAAGGSGAYAVGFAVGMMLVYGLLGLIYLAMGLYLWRFGSAIKRVTLYRRSNDLEAALSAQRSFWRLVGIIIIVIMAIYALILVGAIVTQAFL